MARVPVTVRALIGPGNGARRFGRVALAQASPAVPSPLGSGGGRQEIVTMLHSIQKTAIIEKFQTSEGDTGSPRSRSP